MPLRILLLAILLLLVWRLIRRDLVKLFRRPPPPVVDPSATIETMQCKTCKAYVPVGTRQCGNADCPFPGK